jgi:hypothetical protein
MHMTTRTTAPAKFPCHSHPLTHCVQSLLHTLRCIAQYEDALCEVLHELQQEGPSAKMNEEIASLLDDIPAQDYLDDLESARACLSQPPRHPVRQPKRHASPSTASKNPRSGASRRMRSRSTSSHDLGKEPSRRSRRKPSR